MYQVPVLFPQVSNRESWRQIIEIADDDTGDLINLLDGGGNSLYTITLQISPSQPRGSAGGFLPGPYPYYDDEDCNPVITQTLSAGMGATSNPALAIVDVGTISIFIPKKQFSSLRGTRSYDVYMTVYEPDDDDGRQLFVGRIPVLYGGRNT
jgi:hypothetical protein